MGQIYKITNIINNLVYIGQTKYKAIDRYNAHMNTYKNTYFYNSIHKYGQENFVLEILEDNVANDKLDEREIYWIDKYDSYHNGYNETIGGQGTIGYIFTEEDLKKKSKSMKETWKISKKLNNPERNKKISDKLKNVPKSKEHKEKLSVIASKRTGHKNGFYDKHHSNETKNKISDKNSKSVDMYDMNMNFIKTFKNAKIAATYLQNLLKLNIQHESIYRAINWHCVSGKSYKNYYWKYHKV